eukprot:TRINITY_DN444_c0_g1_i3.p1 TRINITY_DN444_c0_g1~~TRINITY_DN444_c0_g1_i3.p1  ORF type:complete len:605 (-),score=125.70 TRINITY_DN444_c0_g1_i3:305-2119(-)
MEKPVAPELHKRWALDGPFVPLLDSEASTIESPASQEVLRFLDEDFGSLLSAPHHVFWSSFIYTKSVSEAVVSALRYFPRSYDATTNSLSATAQSVYRRLLLICFRLSTARESESEFLSPEFHSRTLTEQKLLNLSWLFDIAALYAASNEDSVRTVMANAFKAQPSLAHQLDRAVQVATKSWSDIAVAAAIQSPLEASSMDMIRFVLDSAGTLSAFVRVYPPAAHAFCSKSVFASFTAIYQYWLGAGRSSVILQRTSLMVQSMCAELIRHGFVECLSTEQARKCVACSTMKKPVVVEQLKLVLDALTSIPALGTEVSPELFHDLADERDLLSLLLAVQRSGISDGALEFVIQLLKTEQIKKKAHNKSNLLQRPDIDLKIAAVCEMFPDLGDGFAETCLRYYEDNVEQVIGALLEGNLPPHIDSVPRDLKRAGALPEYRKATSEPTPALQQRRNVFDSDNFDIKTVDRLPQGLVHVGKQIDALSLEDHMNRHVASKDPGMYVRSNPRFLYDDYEDEYDDSYDDVMKYNVTVESGDVEAARGRAHAGSAVTTTTTTTTAGAGPARTHQVIRMLSQHELHSHNANLTECFCCVISDVGQRVNIHIRR